MRLILKVDGVRGPPIHGLDDRLLTVVARLVRIERQRPQEGRLDLDSSLAAHVNVVEPQHLGEPEFDSAGLADDRQLVDVRGQAVAAGTGASGEGAVARLAVGQVAVDEAVGIDVFPPGCSLR